MRSCFICNAIFCHVLTLFGLLRPSEFERKGAEHFMIGTGVLTERPVIGIITRPNPTGLLGDEFLDGMYVRNLQMAGAQVVPIMPKKDRQYYEKIVNSVNGIFLPGGGANHTHSTYSNTSRILFDLAIEANNKGDYFPIWGTCLGSHLLIKLVSPTFVFTVTGTKNMTLPSNLRPGYRRSRLFRHMPQHLLNYLRDKNASMHNHLFSAEVTDFYNNHALKNFYRVGTTNIHGEHEFVATFEAFNYPFYGSVWHPERSIFNWANNLTVDHRYNAMQISRYFADFFVGEARKNSHRFESKAEEGLALIENFERVYEPNSAKGERYYFNYTDDTK